jgi:hypothetical protein
MKSMNSGLLDNMDLGTIIRGYGLTALIATALAFVVFRTIAKNSGRWDYIKGIFSKKGVRNTRPEMEYYTEEGDLGLQNTHYEAPVKKSRLITVSLIVGIVICVTLMIANEIYVPEVQEQSGEKFYAIVRFFSFLKF